MKKILEESLNIPCEGIFWWIDDSLVWFADEVNPKDPFDSTDLLHRDVWNKIKENYKVNNKVVSFDYFPRGRVEVLVILDVENMLTNYEANIYMDNCIDRLSVRNEIEKNFRLYLKNVSVSYEGQLFLDGSHYTCHNCRN